MELSSVPISAIEVTERFRKDFGDVSELAQDISENGLINPITLKATNEGVYKLLAGERRLKACISLKFDEVPARIYHRDLTERDQLCIELSENLRRKDFTPMEEVALKKRIHDLHVAEHGKKVSKTPDAKGWSGTDTAKFLGESAANVSYDLKLARMMEEFPDIGWENMKTKKDCRDLFKKISKQAVVSTRVAAFERETKAGGVTKHIQNMIDAFVIGDFFEHAKKMDDKTFDLIEVDPPYAIDLRKTKKGYGYGNDYNEIVRNKYADFLSLTFSECYRLLRPGGWLVCWFAPEPWFEQVYQLLLRNHFVTHRMCGIWTKSSGQTNQPSTTLANAYEMFFYARKGDATLQKPGRSNIFNFTPVHPSRKIHPTERPQELIREVLETFALPGDRLLVPFAGSGATLRAGLEIGMKPVGFDLSQSYKDDYTVRILEEFQVKAPEQEEPCQETEQQAASDGT